MLALWTTFRDSALSLNLIWKKYKKAKRWKIVVTQLTGLIKLFTFQYKYPLFSSDRYSSKWPCTYRRLFYLKSYSPHHNNIVWHLPGPQRAPPLLIWTWRWFPDSFTFSREHLFSRCNMIVLSISRSTGVKCTDGNRQSGILIDRGWVIIMLNLMWHKCIFFLPSMHFDLFSHLHYSWTSD